MSEIELDPVHALLFGIYFMHRDNNLPADNYKNLPPEIVSWINKTDETIEKCQEFLNDRKRF